MSRGKGVLTASLIDDWNEFMPENAVAGIVVIKLMIYWSRAAFVPRSCSRRRVTPMDLMFFLSWSQKWSYIA
jgi:hypothetical protein